MKPNENQRQRNENFYTTLMYWRSKNCVLLV